MKNHKTKIIRFIQDKNELTELNMTLAKAKKNNHKLIKPYINSYFRSIIPYDRLTK